MKEKERNVSRADREQFLLDCITSDFGGSPQSQWDWQKFTDSPKTFTRHICDTDVGVIQLPLYCYSVPSKILSGIDDYTGEYYEEVSDCMQYYCYICPLCGKVIIQEGH
jgi:hypothetical protein